MENPFVKLVREGELSAENRKVVGIGREIRDGVFTWWEKYEGGDRGQSQEDYSANASSGESVKRRVKELLEERGLSDEQ